MKRHTLFLLFRDFLLTVVNILGGLFKCRFMLGEQKSENSLGTAEGRLK